MSFFLQTNRQAGGSTVAQPRCSGSEDIDDAPLFAKAVAIALDWASDVRAARFGTANWDHPSLPESVA